MSFKEFIGIAFISLLETLIIMCGIILVANLIKYNYDLAIRFCDANNIPGDLALTMTSMGFANNLTFALTIIGIFVFYPFFKLLMFLNKRVHNLMY